MKLFLIDGHALIFKMYYAFLGRPMVNSKGEDTSILFGFTKYLLELIEREHPTHLTLARALEYIDIIKPKTAYLVHMCHDFTHEEWLDKLRGTCVAPAYDGLELEV